MQGDHMNTNLEWLVPQIGVLVDSVYIHHHSHSLNQVKHDENPCTCSNTLGMLNNVLAPVFESVVHIVSLF